MFIITPIVHIYTMAGVSAWHFLKSPFIIGALLDTLRIVILMTIVLGALMVHPRTRRVTCAVIKFTNRHAPAWAKPAMIACAFFPGQADEIVLVAILLFPILRNSRHRRTFMRAISYAWKVR